MKARFFQSDDADRWDAFCADALGATFLHSRRFLSYHGDKFTDCSVVVEDKGHWVGVMPAAHHPDEAGVVVSHPGSTYGGLLHGGPLCGAGMLQAFRAVGELLSVSGATTLQYKVVPAIYHRAPAQDDLYALFRLGGKRFRCDLSSCIDLSHRLPVSGRRRRGRKSALRNGLSIAQAGPGHLAPLWQILQDNLWSRHAARPVHTLDELKLLLGRFPNDIQVMVALSDDHVVAGLVLFCTERVAHAQYIASSDMGRELNALDLLFEEAIERGQTEGRRYFDFGISTESQGQRLNEGLIQFKSEFGASGVVHEFYEWNLETENAFE